MPDTSPAPLPVRVAALYQFTPFSDCAAIREGLMVACAEHGIKGTLLVANEGINGTIAGAHDDVDDMLDHIRALPGCADVTVKESRAATLPFHRMKVRLKREIVTMGQPDLDLVRGVGTYVAPEDWNALLDEPGTIAIDTRNDYEVGIGSFAGAIDPETETFRDFPAWFRERRDTLIEKGQSPKIAMFCTGGIRCEKATAFLKSEGVEDVYHLKGGILSYLERVPAGDSKWEGECFVFDERVSVTHGLAVGTHELCRACRMPLGPEERQSDHFVEGVCCQYCHETRTDEQRVRYAERHRQTQLAEARGKDHIGAKLAEKIKNADDGYPRWDGFI